MNMYHCEFICLEGVHAHVKLLDDHKGLGGYSGDVCVTSKVKIIDFERKIILTQNSIYMFK